MAQSNPFTSCHTRVVICFFSVTLYRAIRQELKHLQEAPVLQAMEKEMARDKPDMGTLRSDSAATLPFPATPPFLLLSMMMVVSMLLCWRHRHVLASSSSSCVVVVGAVSFWILIC